MYRRAKEKRLKKDAGRTRWSQFFRGMKGSSGGHSPRHDKLLDKDELKVDLDSSFGHHGKNGFVSVFMQNECIYNTARKSRQPTKDF